MKRIKYPFSLEQLMILQSIFTHKNFKAAAKSLGVTQPFVSIQMHHLETQLQTTLFTRIKKQVEFTDTGLLLLRYSNRILSLCKESSRAINSLSSFQEDTLLSIGANQISSTYLLPRILGIFKQVYPTITTQLHTNSTRQVILDILSRKIDIGIVGNDIPFDLKQKVDITPYLEDEFTLIASKSHPVACTPLISKEFLYTLNLLVLAPSSQHQFNLGTLLNDNGIDPKRLRITMELNSIDALKNAVQSSLGVAFSSVSSLQTELDMGLLVPIKVKGVSLNRVLYIILDPTSYQSKASECFKKEILILFLKTLDSLKSF